MCRTLGYTNPQKAIRDHCERGERFSTPTAGEIQSMVVIHEWAYIGLTNSRKAVSVLDDDERVSLKVTSGGQVRSMQAVNESGLYALIVRSNKNKAR